MINQDSIKRPVFQAKLPVNQFGCLGSRIHGDGLMGYVTEGVLDSGLSRRPARATRGRPPPPATATLPPFLSPRRRRKSCGRRGCWRRGCCCSISRASRPKSPLHLGLLQDPGPPRPVRVCTGPGRASRGLLGPAPANRRRRPRRLHPLPLAVHPVLGPCQIRASPSPSLVRPPPLHAWPPPPISGSATNLCCIPQVCTSLIPIPPSPAPSLAPHSSKTS